MEHPSERRAQLNPKMNCLISWKTAQHSTYLQDVVSIKDIGDYTQFMSESGSYVSFRTETIKTIQVS